MKVNEILSAAFITSLRYSKSTDQQEKLTFSPYVTTHFPHVTLLVLSWVCTVHSALHVRMH